MIAPGPDFHPGGEASSIFTGLRRRLPLGEPALLFLVLAGLFLVLPGLVLLPHLLSEHRYKRHLNLRLVLALLIAAGFYAIPFVLSHLYGAPTYGESGLALVFRENVVRFFDPFDHMGPIYTYLIYLPAYTLPWAPCWVLGLWLAVRHWRGQLLLIPN